MPLRLMVQASPETLSDMLLAADDRYNEAEELLVQQRFDGAAYLLGYAAEMRLKATCLRLRGHGPTTQVWSALPPLKAWMRTVAPTVRFTNYHDLAFFAECVGQLRVHGGRPLPTYLGAELRSQVINGLHAEWIVDMRYRRSGLTGPDAWSVLLNAWWVRSNWVSLT